MQSGITASTDLQNAFNTFTDDISLFALPITITKESLTPLPPISFSSSSFDASLPSLEEHLQPKAPIYLILRRNANIKNDLIAVTYVPSISPVRSKMLFASTRSTLVRDLGLEKFGEHVFATDADEVLEPKQWKARAEAGSGGGSGGLLAGSGAGDLDILSTEERELQSVKRAEEEERHGTSGRDLMGSGGSGSSGLKMKTGEMARQALRDLKEDGALVKLAIDLSTEILDLVGQPSNSVQPGKVSGLITTDQPTYTFYQHPGSSSVVFIYTCPASSKVKERMMYASSKNGVLEIAKAEGVIVAKRLEAGGPEEITEDLLAEAVGLEKSNAAPSANSKQGFARPKRPGKR